MQMLSCPSFMLPADPDNDEINRKKVLGTTEEDKMADEVDFSRKG